MINGWHVIALVFLALVYLWARREARLYEEHKTEARERLAASARHAQAADQSLASVHQMWPRAVGDDDRTAA